VRTVPIPDWVEGALQAWLQAAGIAEGRIFRAVSRWGSVVGEKLSTTAVLGTVAEYAALLSDVKDHGSGAAGGGFNPLSGPPI
jgi:hypothetical protein